jgi:hypothetical protein
MNWIFQLITMFGSLLMMGCANHNDLSTSAGNKPTSSAPHINWQSDAYTLIEVPRLKMFFILIKPVNSIFYPSITPLKIRALMGISAYINI